MPTSLRPAAVLLLPLLLVGACNDAAAPAGAPEPVGGVAQQPPAATAPAAWCTPLAELPANQHLVTSWKTAPGDALITHPISGLSVRQSFAPHFSGEQLRLRLSNRYSSVPLTIDSLYIARESAPGSAEMLPGTACQLRFAGQTRVTIPAGATLNSDLVHYPVRSFERLGISFFAPEASPQLTRHLNANEKLYMSQPGDHAADPGGTAFQPVPDGYAGNVLVIEALEVAAPTEVTTLVAVGDSITDGSGSTTGFMNGEPAPMLSTDQRYPNHLQRRIDAAGLPLAVANAGIGGNELLGDGWLPQFGRALLTRLEHDVLSVTGASHVLAMIGTNDLGNPKAGGAPSVEAMIAGYTELITRTQAAGLAIVLGTIPPAEGTVLGGLPLGEQWPAGVGVMHGTAEARSRRDAINDWIRQQQLSDGIVDFAACLENPQRPGYLAPEYNSGDNLHPSPAGYAAMAACVDLNLFLTPSSAARP